MTAGLFVLALAAPSAAEPTRQLYISDPAEVLMGDPVSTSIDAMGHVSVGPVVESYGKALGRPVTALAAQGKRLYAGTAGAKLYEVASPRSVTERLAAKDKVVSALQVAADGTALVGLAPGGEVLRVRPGQKPETFAKLTAKYAWGFVRRGKRTIIATGQPGQLVAVADGQKPEVLFDPGESHLRALSVHPQRGLIVGGGQKGIVYQVDDKGRARALYDSKFGEVTAFAIDTKFGHLYAAFVSADKAGKPLPERWIGPTKDDSEKKKDRSPFKGSEVVRIRPSGQVEVLWSSNDEGAMALHYDGAARRLYFSTGTAPDSRARIYAIEVGDRDRLSLWARLEPALAPVMVAGPKGQLFVGTAPAGQLYRVGQGSQAEGTYLSVEQDLQRTARVGRVWFDADMPKGTSVEISVRSGNTKKPDDTWSKWSASVSDPMGGGVQVPDARYVQLRAVLKRAKGRSPRLKAMYASVVRHNVAPVVRQIFPLRRGVALKALPTESSKAKTLTLTPRSLQDLRKPPKNERRQRVRQTTEPGMITVSWRATDADGDDLLFRVEMRRVEPPTWGWRELDRNREAPFWSFDSRAFADGYYQFRVLANDRPSNAPAETLTDIRTSDRILIDNTSPRLVGAKASSPRKGRLRVEAVAKDARSPLETAQVSVNGGPWLMLPAADGLLDAREEKLSVELTGDDLPAGGTRRMVVRIRVVDAANNEASTSARALLKR